MSALRSEVLALARGGRWAAAAETLAAAERALLALGRGSELRGDDVRRAGEEALYHHAPFRGA